MSSVVTGSDEEIRIASSADSRDPRSSGDFESKFTEASLLLKFQYP